MYEWFLFIHSWLRWVLALVLLATFVRSCWGWKKKSPFRSSDNVRKSILVGLAHLQLLLGLILYFGLSPLVQSALQDPQASMGMPVLRYWMLEHVMLMLVAVAAIQIGSVAVRKTNLPVRKHKRLAIWSGIAIVLILAGMPWPNRQYGRPLWKMAVSTLSTGNTAP